MTSKKFFLKAPVLLALGAALVFGACDTNAAPAHAVLYGTLFYDDTSATNDDRTAVISANRYRMDIINGTGKGWYVEAAIDLWEEAVNTGTDKETYPAGYKITGTVKAVKGFTNSVGDSYTKDLYLRNDRKAWHTETATDIIYIRWPWPLPKGGN
jgi:hypothetical protein